MTKNKKVSVLLIDDHEEDYFLVRDILAKIKNKPYQLDYCIDPSKALNYLREKSYDVVLIDFHLEKCAAKPLILEGLATGVIEAYVYFNLEEEDEVFESDKILKEDMLPSTLDLCLKYSIQRSQHDKELSRKNIQLGSLVKFQKLVASISKKMLESYGDGFNIEVDSALSELGAFIGVDRCRIYEVIEGKDLDTYRVWSFGDLKGASDPLKKLDSKYFPVLLEEVSKKKTVMIDSNHKSNLWETEISEFVESLGLDTVMLFPLFFNGEWVGVLSLESRKEIRLSEVEHTLMKWFIEMLSDIMERRQSDMTLGKARLQESNAARVKADFLSSMSHELKTPLNSILGMSEVLGDAELESEQSVCVEVIKRAANNLNYIFDDIFTYSHLEDRSLDEKEVSFNIESFLSSKLSSYESKEGKKLELYLKICEGVVSDGRGDQEGLGQIMDHLLSNAIKFTNEGFIRVSVENKITKDGELTILVEDSGIGLSQEDQSKVFDSFYQVDSSLDRAEVGSGLGLTIVKRVLELLDCEIELKSSLGEGTIFKFNFPFKSLQLS